MKGQVIVVLRPDLAKNLRAGAGATTAEGSRLLEVVSEHRARLAPLHPGIDDPELCRYFSLGLPDQAQAQRAIARLRFCSGVEAAYAQPEPSAP